MKASIFCFLWLLLTTPGVWAQIEPSQKAPSKQLDSAIYLSEAGRFEEADQLFRTLLSQLKSIPSDFVYHFGKNSYHLGQYRQSVDWLNKYIQLKGTSGQFSEEAVATLKLAEAALLKERQAQSKEAGEILSQNYDIDCGPTGKVTCPVCRGSTVIIKRSYLGDTYKTCPYCNEHGTLTCEEFNQLVRGKLTPNQP
ncbi:MAG: hypothetical protein AB7K37_14425 [Cyclobacteriaceae bacterium]